MRIRAAFAMVSALLAPVAAFAIAAPRPNFGTAYAVVQDRSMRPVVSGSMLRIPVRYNGGCAPHNFAPHYQTQTMGAIVWLTHATTDYCTTPQVEWVAVPIPPDASSRHLIWLFTPDGQHLQIAVP